MQVLAGLNHIKKGCKDRKDRKDFKTAGDACTGCVGYDLAPQVSLIFKVHYIVVLAVLVVLAAL